MTKEVGRAQLMVESNQNYEDWGTKICWSRFLSVSGSICGDKGEQLLQGSFTSSFFTSNEMYVYLSGEKVEQYR
jgi:hypothetical protein